MAFLARITDGNCSVCLSALGSDAVAHQDGGEQHPIHRKCLEAWMTAQSQRNPIPSCPTCHINLTSIESKKDSFIRMSQEGDLESVIVLLEDRSFFKNYDLAVLKASEAGHHQIVEALLKNGTVLDVFRGLALEAAAQNGNFELVEILLENRRQYEQVPTKSLEASLKIARENGYQNIVKSLEVRAEIRSLLKLNLKIDPEQFHLEIE